MRTALAIPALVVLLFVTRAPTPSLSSEGFSVVVTATEHGWAVDCEKGCSWKGSFTCDEACLALVDSRGVVTLAEIRGPDPAFQFIVQRDRNVVLARARSGTTWTALSWACVDQPCRARVTEAGVTSLEGRI